MFGFIHKAHPGQLLFHLSPDRFQVNLIQLGLFLFFFLCQALRSFFASQFIDSLYELFIDHSNHSFLFTVPNSTRSGKNANGKPAGRISNVPCHFTALKFHKKEALTNRSASFWTTVLSRSRFGCFFFCFVHG
jgi:hypothetical protein